MDRGDMIISDFPSNWQAAPNRSLSGELEKVGLGQSYHSSPKKFMCSTPSPQLASPRFRMGYRLSSAGIADCYLG
jgi:hypothetical protein